MFRPGDLERHTKDAFFNGLRPEYRAMVVHKCDNPDMSITQLLTAIRECEENEENNRRNCRAEYAKAYPPSTSRPTYRADRASGHHSAPAPATGRYQRQDKNVPIHAAHVDPIPEAPPEGYPPQYHEYDDPPEKEEFEFYAEFYAATMDMADRAECLHN